MIDYTEVFDSSGRVWHFSQFGLWHLVRQHVYQKLVRQRTRVVRPDNSRILPNVETNFREIARA